MTTTATVDQVADKTFDYIIVGGGTAGLVLANRLSEDPGTSVLVLEAGAEHLNDPTILLPASYARNFGNPEYDWAFTTVPQKHSDGTVFPWNRGKGLGGSSALNFYVWNRPPAVDIDAWETLGNHGWNWKNFVKYSNKSETWVPPPDDEAAKEKLTWDAAYHGTDGPLGIGFHNGRPGWDVTLEETLNTLGIQTVHEPLGGKPVGTFMIPSSVDPRTNQRSYSVAYLPKTPRANLTILTSALVSRVLLASPGGLAKASGVEFLYADKTEVVHAGREVILSAGAIKSPQILELSGIGHPSILAKAGVDTKVALPGVGKNVQEHLYSGISWELKEPEKFSTLDPLHDPAIAAEQLELYKQGKGLFTVGLVNLTFLPFTAISPRAESIIHEFVEQLVSGKYDADPALKEQYEVQLEIEKKGADLEMISFPGFLSYPNAPEPGKKYISLCPATNHTYSRGTIHITSADPKVQPEIDPHYFEEEIDILKFIEHVRFVRRVAASTPINKYIGKEINPGEAIQSDAEIAAWIKKYTGTTYHTAGSCSMLPRAKGGVVDEALRVYGTSNLRVVDLSIVPIHISSHTQATVYAIAEQAADIIKGRFVA
ncbi:GMC oxidoreductase [Gloeopeniophorella convolvens]|nr:GMC oxidoreductase [Gloeopeniophorella convolvens]